MEQMAVDTDGKAIPEGIAADRKLSNDGEEKRCGACILHSQFKRSVAFQLHGKCLFGNGSRIEFENDRFQGNALPVEDIVEFQIHLVSFFLVGIVYRLYRKTAFSRIKKRIPVALERCFDLFRRRIGARSFGKGESIQPQFFRGPVQENVPVRIGIRHCGECKLVLFPSGSHFPEGYSVFPVISFCVIGAGAKTDLYLGGNFRFDPAGECIAFSGSYRNIVRGKVHHVPVRIRKKQTVFPMNPVGGICFRFSGSEIGGRVRNRRGDAVFCASQFKTGVPQQIFPFGAKKNGADGEDTKNVFHGNSWDHGSSSSSIPFRNSSFCPSGMEKRQERSPRLRYGYSFSVG